MFENEVVPYLEGYQDGVLVSKVLRVCGIPEGHMEEMILDIIDSQTNPTIASYAKENEVTIRITSKVENKADGEKLIELVENMIRQRLGGTPEKPVGLVYLGLCIKGTVKTMKLNLSGDRQHIRNTVVVKALDWLRRELMNI